MPPIRFNVAKVSVSDSVGNLNFIGFHSFEYLT
jgi:hypothetical protein